jgi:hypothetical protein
MKKVYPQQSLAGLESDKPLMLAYIDNVDPGS